jgi:hypothetical protein
MKKITFLFLIALSLNAAAQTANNLYGIVRKNYYTNIVSPFDSTLIWQQFDSATIRLGYTDPSLGFINNRGPFTYNQAVNLTGAALNPYDSTFVFLGGYGLNTFNLNQGNITVQAPLYNPIAPSYLDNFRFNNADSTMYGLARRNTFDSLTWQTVGEIYLAKLNSPNGLITQISASSVGQGFALSGSAIDPYQMLFYYSKGSNLVGLDLYDGSIFSDVPISISNGNYFDNFTYSCADTSLYGLIRTNYFSYIVDSAFPLDSFQVLDSATVRLGKINPSTGVVTTISPYSISQGGYSLNAGAAIDPDAMIYYYNNGSNLIGVSLITGTVVSVVTLAFEDGMYFDLMRNFENCKSARSMRLSPVATMAEINSNQQAFVYPNPSEGIFTVKSNYLMKQITVTAIDGKVLQVQNSNSNQTTINLETLDKGIYFLTLVGLNNQVEVKKVIIN